MSKHILVVEDSRTQALQIQLLLEDAGYRISVAENGQAGLEAVEHDQPDLIITDIDMPIMDGYELTHRLKTDLQHASLPVIMLTSLNQPLNVVRGLEMGADHFVTKPYNDDYLIERITELFTWQAQARAGQLPQQQQLQRFSQDIIINRSREQILQSLLQATARILDCQAMMLLLNHADDSRTMFSLSFAPLDEAVLEKVTTNIVDLLGRVRRETIRTLPSRTVQIVLDPLAEPIGPQIDLVRSYLNAPLIAAGKVTGMLAVYNSRPNAFDIKHIGFLFEMGQKAADALSRLKVG